MRIPADRLAHEVLSHTEMLRQGGDILAALNHGFIQILHWDQVLDGPLVGPVLMLLTDIQSSVPVVKAAGFAVAQLMAL